jgi:signal transduction histidine kinase/CheY-like chemotaxis protein
MSVVSHKDLITPLFEAISTRPSQNLNADVFALAVLDPDQGECELYINNADELSAEIIQKFKQEAVASWKLSKEQAFKTVCDSIRNLNNNCAFKPLLSALNCHRGVISPFEMEDVGGGIIVWAWYEQTAEFDSILVEKSKLITEQIKLSLKLALNEQKGQELSTKLAALLELSTAIYSSLNYTEVLEKAIHLSMKIIGADGGSIFIIDKKENLLRPLVTIDKSHEEELSKVALKLGEGLTGIVAQSGIGLISNHSEEDPRAFQVPGTPNEPESIISAPLSWSGEVIGAITLRSTCGKQFNQEDLDVLTIFARQTADAIENAKLYESLEKSYKELANTQEQLVMTEKLRALGEMAGGVAHDFNNVLGAILGRTQLLLGETTDPRWTENLKQIEQVTLAGARTVQKLQNFTRISSHGQFEQVDLNKVIADAMEITKPRWKDECQLQGVIIDMRCECQDVDLILGNKAELVEAISNLILNAVDALAEGGYIKIKSLMKNNRAIVRVEDNGIGMADATLNRVFYPFFTTKGLKNTGMGLAVVYGIVTRHSGEIDVSSKLGEGTTCTLYFPTAGKVETVSTKPAEVVQEIKAKILIIDDDDNIRDVMSDMLEFMDHTTSQAASGEEGAEKFRDGDFDLVITDLGMPGISGWEVTRICKSLKPNIPVIMISGWGNQLDDELVRQSGLDAIMAKPFEMTKIKSLIQDVLAKKQSSPVNK